MAVFRLTPTCSYCNEVIAEAVYKELPTFVAGDSFIRWNYLNHSCEGSIKGNKEMKESLHEMMANRKFRKKDGK